VVFSLLRTLNESFIPNKYSEIIARGILVPFKVRLIGGSGTENESDSILSLLNRNHTLVHKDSVLAGDLINYKI
jgi:hypothetical protein